jgi:putative membrane protein
MQYWDNDHMDGAWAGVMVLGMVGFGVLLAVVIVWAIRSSRPPYTPATGAQISAPDPTAGHAEQILARRLARGEVDPDEYRSKLAALRSDSAS